MNSLISVVVPVYNSEKTIKSCLESICNQSYKDLEILVVYLNGEDNSLQAIQSVRDKRIRIIEQVEKTGPGGARNLGIDAAKGEWIGFVEADDTIALDFYERLLNAAIENNCDIAQGEIILNGKQWTFVKENKILENLEEKYSSLQNGASFDKLFKLDFVRKNNIRFSEKVRWEDNPFVFKAFYFGKIVMVKGAVYYYNPTRWSDAYRQKLKNDIIPVCQEIMDFAGQCSLTESDLLLIKRKIVTNLVLSFIDDKEIYRSLMKMMDNSSFLRILHYKKVVKATKKKIFHTIFPKKRRLK